MRPCIETALDCVLAVEGFALGGRIECFLVGKPAVGRGRPAIMFDGREILGVCHSNERMNAPNDYYSVVGEENC